MSLPEEVRKAVERLERFALAGNACALQEWQTIRANLLAREAEIAKCHRSVDHTQQWYAVRFERLKDLGKEKGCWSEMAAIMANGTVSVFETPTYAQQMNMLRHRAERAEALLRETRTIVLELCNCYAHPCPQATIERITAHLSENSRG